MSNQLLSPCHIFSKSDFHKLEFYVELEFHELEFQNSDKLLNISIKDSIWPFWLANEP